MTAEERAQILRALSALEERPPRSIEELRFRIEPLRPLRGAAIGTLLERLERGDGASEIASAVLQELVGAEDVDVLVAAFRRSAGSGKLRTSLAQLIAGVASDRLEELLTEDELHEVSRLSIDELLDRMRDRDGLSQAIELYRSCGRSERSALLAAVEEATDREGAPVSLASALETLFPEEPDERLRAQMVYLLAARRQPDSARVLTRWRARLRGPERGLVDRALERLLRSGVRPAPVARAAWISGVDGTACFNVGISFPAPLGLRDVVLACISLESGLRAVSLLSAVESETIDEIQRALEEGQGIPVAAIEVAEAFRAVAEAKARTLALGRKLPEGYRDAHPYLERPLSLWRRPATVPAPERSAARRLPALLDLPGYRSWTIDPSEAPAERDDTPAGADAARSLLERLAGGPSERRLVAMLRHQAAVHRRRRETAIAARSEAAAREIESRGIVRSAFALRLAERSIPYLARRAPRTPRSDVREPLKRRLEAAGRLRRRQVAVLDLGEALYREIENVNDAFPPADRLTLAQMEAMALAAAEIATAEFTRDSTEEPSLPGLEAGSDVKPGAVRRRLRTPATRIRLESAIVARLREETGVFNPSTRRLAEALARVAVWFADEVCLGRCGRGCLVEPLADGRSAFYAPVHPAGIDLSSAEPRGTGTAPPASLAIQRYLGRRLEERAEAIREFLEGLAGLSADRGRERERVVKLETLRSRLLRAREEVEALDRDPAALYGFVDQSLVLDEDAAALARPLLVEALRALRAPDPAAADPHRLVVRRRLERALRTLGLLEVDPGSLEAAAALAPRPGSLVALFELATARRPAHVLRSLKATLAELWSRSRPDAAGGAPGSPR